MVAPNAVDISNWSGPLTLAVAQAWKADGVELVIIGCSVPATSVQQAQVCVAAGLKFHLYIYLTYSADVTTQVALALSVGSQFPQAVPDVIWLDAEDETGSLTVDQRIAQHVRARNMV
ncbi:MAG: hypothetical protein KGL39_42410, partial [Patescibacteria group bacterium]|nr:hypothetical protein [Patescibacteria group bacterium]